MTLKTMTATVLLASIPVFPGNASALTMDQFTALCESRQEACSEHPILQAYVGGALDLIAMLDEQTDYLDEIYCEDPSTLFDVPAIIRYLQIHREEYADRNAMLLVIRYLVEKGGC